MKCVTHTAQALNESIEKARILAAFVFTDPIYVGELRVCRIASPPHKTDPVMFT